MFPIDNPRQQDEILKDIGKLNNRLYWLERELMRRKRLDQDCFESILQSNKTKDGEQK